MAETIPLVTAPPLVQTLRWLKNPMAMLDECQARYGDIFTLRIIGFGTVIVTAIPEMAKELFAASQDDVYAGKATKVLRPFLGKHSVIVLDGPEHDRQRRLLMPAFHGERMTAYGKTMIEQTHLSIDRWPLGKPFALHKEMGSVTLQVILRTVFGMEEGARLQRLSELLAFTLDQVSSPFLLFGPLQKDWGRFSPWGRFVRLSASVDEILFGEIASRRAKAKDEKDKHLQVQAALEKRTDVLSMMLLAKDDEGRRLSADELRDQLITLLVAGHETTATALCWAFRHLLLPDQQELLQKLKNEIEGTRSQEDGELDPNKIAQLDLLDATVRETLRLQPVIPLVGRELRKPMRIAGYDLPKGSLVAPSIYLNQRRASVYPEPKRFLPERFLGQRPSIVDWLPFGGGSRRCLGAAFALYEMKMVLATILSRTSLNLADTKVRAVRRSITLTPSSGLKVVLQSRAWRRVL